VTNAQGCKREESGRAIEGEGRDKERCKLTRLARLAATEEATTSAETTCVRRADRRWSGRSGRAGMDWEEGCGQQCVRAVVNGEWVGLGW
jgi:hypothetical protein